VAFVTLREGANAEPEDRRNFANARLGKMQRISEVRILEALPRSALGEILKRELQQELAAASPRPRSIMRTGYP
jgi:long-chain acyl-CoA synthetase